MGAGEQEGLSPQGRPRHRTEVLVLHGLTRPNDSHPFFPLPAILQGRSALCHAWWLALSPVDGKPDTAYALRWVRLLAATEAGAVRHRHERSHRLGTVHLQLHLPRRRGGGGGDAGAADLHPPRRGLQESGADRRGDGGGGAGDVPRIRHRGHGRSSKSLAPDSGDRGLQLAQLDAHLGRDRPQRLPAAQLHHPLLHPLLALLRAGAGSEILCPSGDSLGGLGLRDPPRYSLPLRGSGGASLLELLTARPAIPRLGLLRRPGADDSGAGHDPEVHGLPHRGSDAP